MTSSNKFKKAEIKAKERQKLIEALNSTSHIGECSLEN
jgi:hypothetical protein